MPTLQLAIESRKAEEGQRKFSEATKKVSQSAGVASKSVKGLDSSLNAAGARASSVSGKMAGLAASFVSFVALTRTIRIIADFEQVMSTVGGVTAATADELERMTKAAQEMGATTRFTAKEAGDSLLFLARAGFSVQEALTALPATLDLAAAGAIDLGTAGDIASNVLAQFGLEAEQLTRVGDVLIKVTNSSNTNVLQLAEAMKMVGPVAGAMGVSVEKTAAAIGLLGNNGIQATMAGTQLRGMFAALLGPTEGAQKVIKKLGLTIEELNPETNELITISRKLRDAHMSAADAVEIFGRRNVAAALILSKNVEEFENLYRAALIASGTMAEMADRMEDNLAGSFRLVRSAAQDVALALGEAGVSGALRNVLGEITAGLRSFSAFVRSIEETESGVKLVTQAIEGLTIALGFMGLLGAMHGIIAALKLLTVATLSNPWTAAASAIALAVGALYSYRDATIEIGNETYTMGLLVLGIWTTISQVVGDTVERMSDWFKEVGESLGFTSRYDSAKRTLALYDRLGYSPMDDPMYADAYNYVSQVDAARNVGADKGGFQGSLVDAVKNNIESLRREMARQGLISGEAGKRPPIEPVAITLKRAALGPLQTPVGELERIGRETGAMGPFPTDSQQAQHLSNQAAIEDNIAILNKQRDVLVEMMGKEIQDKQKEIIALGEEMGSSFTNAFNDMILGANSATEAIRNLGLEIARIALTQSITGPIGSAIGSGISGAFGSLLGGAFGGGAHPLVDSYKPMAEGGIVTRPTFAMIGEAGPEAVVPLDKMMGKTVVNFNITTPNADSFRKSKRQIVQDFGPILGGR